MAVLMIDIESGIDIAKMEMRKTVQTPIEKENSWGEIKAIIKQ